MAKYTTTYEFPRGIISNFVHFSRSRIGILIYAGMLSSWAREFQLISLHLAIAASFKER